jgi:membrane protein DedA with SNARE-associated domain
MGSSRPILGCTVVSTWREAPPAVQQKARPSPEILAMVFLLHEAKEENMLDTLEQTILSALQVIFDQFGWYGVFGLMIFENATGITPSEIILAFAGWMLIEHHGISASFIPLAGLYAGLGSTIGASIPYWIARLGGRPLVNRFAGLFRIHLDYIARIEDQCRQWGAGIVMVGRIIPGVRTLISIPAGLVRIPFPKFFFATFVGAYVWCTLLIGAGFVLGQEWHLVSGYIKRHLPLIFAIGLLMVSAYLLYRHRASLPIPRWIRQNNEELE